MTLVVFLGGENILSAIYCSALSVDTYEYVMRMAHSMPRAHILYPNLGLTFEP
jgi:hypothetical protein